jgi:hypothetical protein
MFLTTKPKFAYVQNILFYFSFIPTISEILTQHCVATAQSKKTW